MVGMAITRIRFSGQKFGSDTQLFPAAGFGSSEISPAPRDHKPGFSIRQNQTLCESGFLWPHTPARCLVGAMGHGPGPGPSVPWPMAQARPMGPWAMAHWLCLAVSEACAQCFCASFGDSHGPGDHEVP